MPIKLNVILPYFYLKNALKLKDIEVNDCYLDLFHSFSWQISLLKIKSLFFITTFA
jgi:hypothetical protein